MPARLHTRPVCQVASLAFHHRSVSRSCTATSTVPIRRSSVTRPLIHTGEAAGAAASFVGDTTVVRGAVVSAVTGDAAGRNTLIRSFSASATYRLPAASCVIPEGLENWYGPCPFVPQLPRKEPSRPNAWIRLSFESVTYST